MPDSSPHSDLEIVRHYLNGFKRIVDGPDDSFTTETPPSVKPALAALGRLEEQLQAAQQMATSLNEGYKEQEDLREILEAALQLIADNAEVVMAEDGEPVIVYGRVDAREVAAEALAAVRQKARDG